MQVYYKQISSLLSTFMFIIESHSTFVDEKIHWKLNHWKGFLYQLSPNSLWNWLILEQLDDLTAASDVFGKWVQDQKVPTCFLLSVTALQCNRL